MYNFLNYFMTQNQRQNIRPTTQPYSFSNIVSRNNRNNTFVGNNLMRTLYRGNHIQEINNTTIQNENTVPVFQTNLETSLYEILDNNLNDDDMDLPIIEYQSNENESFDMSFNRDSLLDVAQIVPGTNDTTFYMNFPNEEQTDNSTLFYTLFENSNYRIQYNHDQLLSYDESEALYNHILSTVHTDEHMQDFINSTLDNSESYHRLNNDETKQNKMKENIHIGPYRESKSLGLLNDTCPIMLEEFKYEDEVCIFINCNHGIHASQLDTYLHTFYKCPLCNAYIVPLLR